MSVLALDLKWPQQALTTASGSCGTASLPVDDCCSMLAAKTAFARMVVEPLDSKLTIQGYCSKALDFRLAEGLSTNVLQLSMLASLMSNALK